MLIDVYKILVSFLLLLINHSDHFFSVGIEPLSADLPATNTYDNGPPGYGSVCSIDSDCQQATSHLQCNQRICVCLDGYVPLGKYLCYNIHGQGKTISYE